MKKESNLIVNADDFGLNPLTSRAIIESFNLGAINSTSIMANMPGFDDAVELAHKNKITNKIGIHLNLTDGIPMTRGILNPGLYRVNQDGDLKRHMLRLFLLNGADKRLIFKELATQIERVKEAGIPITHIDTHHHFEEVLPLTQIVIALLKEYRIPSMRILNNLNGSTLFYKSIYRRMINRVITNNGVNFTDYFGNQVEASAFLKIHSKILNEKKLEIMVHPVYDNSGKVVDRLEGKDYGIQTPQWAFHN
jgi:chitin disaccharide deacetylase